MAKLTWRITNQTQSNLDITQYVRSLTYTIGRPNAVSPYAGGKFSFTMTNTSDQVNYAEVQDFIRIAVKGTGAYFDAFVGFVSQRDYQDGPGTALNSTVTISGVDEIAMFGPINNVSIAESDVFDLLDDYSAAVTYARLLGSTDLGMNSASSSINGLQAVNNVIAGDGGVVSGRTYYSPKNFPLYIKQTNFTFEPTTSASKIAYQTFSRVEGASNGTFFTSASVTNQNGGATLSANAANVSVYGQRFVTVTTAESSVSDTQDWYANAFSNPDTYTFFMSFTDVAQNATALDFLPDDLFFEPSWSNVSFTPPGGVATSGWYWPEQIRVNVVPEATTVNLVMSPISYYGRFILDDAVFGVLGGVPTYNSEIDYDEIGFIYDDGNVEQGSRLGV
jgi:hypothetical protein